MIDSKLVTVDHLSHHDFSISLHSPQPIPSNLISLSLSPSISNILIHSLNTIVHQTVSLSNLISIHQFIFIWLLVVQSLQHRQSFHSRRLPSFLSHHLHSSTHSSSSRPWLWILCTAIGSGLCAHSHLHSRPSLRLETLNQHLTPPSQATDELKDHDSDRSLIRKGLDLIEHYVIEPLATTRRFLYLLTLFLPLVLTSPVLLLEYVELGHPAKRRKRNSVGALVTERRTTTWWYFLLVNAMQRAGPTFIKASDNFWGKRR